MDFSAIQEFTQKDTERFKSVCNQLLSRTFLVRSVYHPDKGHVNNPDYTFLTVHYETVRNYLSLLDWDLRRDEYNGFFYVQNTDEANRCNLNKTATAILLAIRLIYDENQERIGLNNDVICTVRDVLEKTVTDYAILTTRPNMEEIKRSLNFLEYHTIIQKIDGRFNQTDCKFSILPTVLTAVSSERLEAVVNALKKENEEGEEVEKT